MEPCASAVAYPGSSSTKCTQVSIMTAPTPSNCKQGCNTTEEGAACWVQVYPGERVRHAHVSSYSLREHVQVVASACLNIRFLLHPLRALHGCKLGSVLVTRLMINLLFAREKRIRAFCGRLLALRLTLTRNCANPMPQPSSRVFLEMPALCSHIGPCTCAASLPGITRRGGSPPPRLANPWMGSGWRRLLR